MFWKIVFGLYSLFLFAVMFKLHDNNSSAHMQITNLEAFGGILCIAGIYFLFNILYALARKIRTLSLRSTKALIIFAVLGNISLCISALYDKIHAYHPLRVLAGFEILLIITAILLLPLYIPLISYMKQFPAYNKALQHSFFKVLTLFLLVFYNTPMFCKELYLLTTEPLSESLLETIVFLACSLYIIVCYAGYVMKKDFIPKKILKWTWVPVFVIWNTGLSITELKSGIQEAVNWPVILNVFLVFVLVVEFLILYRYANTEVESETEDCIEVESETKSENQFISEIDKNSFVLKWVYILLILVGGGLGLHKFYAGKIRIGILYLLFVWTSIPFWVSIVELIIAILKQPNSEGKIIV